MSLDARAAAPTEVGPRDAVAILAPHGRDSEVATSLLSGEGVAALPVADLHGLAGLLRADVGCALVTEEALAGPGAAAVQAALDAQPAWSDVPFVVLAIGGRRDRGPGARARLDALPNAVLLSRPLHAEELVRAVRSALAARARQHETRRHLEQLAQREAEFHAISDSVDQMIWTTRPDGHHDYFNRRWYEFTGTPTGSTDGEGWLGIFHEDDRVRTRETWERSLATGEPYEIEYRLRHHTGAYRWVLGRAQAARDETGAIARWYGTCTDIHDEVTAREAAVDDLKRQRDTAWDLAQDLLAVAENDGTLSLVNATWTRLLGWEEEDLIGQPFIPLTHPDDLEETLATFSTIFERPLAKPYEYRLRHRDGSYRWFAWTATSHQGRVYAFGRDVTERRAAEAARDAAETQLRQAQKLETIGQLTGGVAHDFNNLLMAIRASLDLLARALPKGDARVAGLIDNAVRATERGASLTQRMLAFARRQELRSEAVDVAALLPGLRDLMARTVGPQVEIALAVDEGVPAAMVDVNQLEMALLNLAVNARDAMDGVGRMTVTLDAERVEGAGDLRPGDYLRIAIADEGAGMDAATLTQATEPFFTTKGVGRGTGLGLSMVHGLAAQSNGTFRLESAPGQGTTATLYLPAADPSAATAAAPDEPAAPVAEAAGRRRVVLAVDDDALVLMGTAGLLEDLGHEVIEAHSGAAALDALAERPDIDLVVTDQAMPKMTGVQLAATIRSLRPDLPVVLATGYAEMPEGAASLVTARLEKPFSEAQLERTLSAIP